MIDDQEIEAIVLTTISAYRSDQLIQKNARLMEDIGLCSDDATAVALELESVLQIWLPRDEWRNVTTVQDVIGALTKRYKSDLRNV